MNEKQYEKSFSRIEPPQVPAGLFDKIILAIRREQELHQTKKLLLGFLFLAVISCVSVVFSWGMLARQIESSGFGYLISTVFADFGTFLAIWQDFSLAILETLPLAGIVAFMLSASIAIFTIRLFFYRKRLLFGYVKNLIVA
jgi:hypothetical protein